MARNLTVPLGVSQAPAIAVTGNKKFAFADAEAPRNNRVRLGGVRLARG